jgi:hypothetical protein
MRVSYVNYVDDATASGFTVLGSATGFPITNVQEQRLSVRWRSTACTAQTIIIDIGTSRAVNTAAIIQHNISSSATASSIIVSSNIDPTFTAGNVLTTLTRNSDMIVGFFDTQPTGHRYYQFAIDDPLNTDGYLEIGRLWLGSYIQINPSSLNDFTVTKHNSDTVAFGKNRQKYATAGETWRSFEMSFPPTKSLSGDNTWDISNVITLYDTVGKHDSFIFCNFDDLTTYDLVKPCYVSISNDIGFNHDKRQYYEWSLVMEENK